MSSGSQAQWWCYVTVEMFVETLMLLIMGAVSASGTTFLFGCTNMIKWSVRILKVYKPLLFGLYFSGMSHLFNVHIYLNYIYLQYD